MSTWTLHPSDINCLSKSEKGEVRDVLTTAAANDEWVAVIMTEHPWEDVDVLYGVYTKPADQAAEYVATSGSNWYYRPVSEFLSLMI